MTRYIKLLPLLSTFLATVLITGMLLTHAATAHADTPPPANTTQEPTEPTSTPEPQMASEPPEQAETPASRFRVGPTSSIRPVNDVISKNQDGLVEILFRNPSLNDSTMEVELSVSVPSGFHLYGKGFATDVAAGTASGTFTVPPAHSRTIFLNVKADKVGHATLHFSGHFWPTGNKDFFNPISLTHPFTVTEPSKDPLQAPEDTQEDGEDVPIASCTLGSTTTGDFSLLCIALFGMVGLVLVRKKR